MGRGGVNPCCCFCNAVIFKSLTTQCQGMFASACFSSSVTPANLFSHPPDAAWRLCSPLPSTVNWSTTPASWKISWWIWSMPPPPRTPSWCCGAPSLLWRKCWPTGCPSACTATSRWGRGEGKMEQIFYKLNQVATSCSVLLVQGADIRNTLLYHGDSRCTSVSNLILGKAG